MSSLKKLLKKKKYHQIKLRTTAAGHLTLNIELNGVKGHFILDTGANNSVVAKEMAAQFQLETTESNLLVAGPIVEQEKIMLNVELNGVKGRLVLESGDNTLEIAREMAERFQLETSESDAIVEGPIVEKDQTLISENNSLSIGKWKTENFTALLIDLSHVNALLEQQNIEPVSGIIGAEILENGKAIIDYDKKVLYLRKIKKFNKNRIFEAQKEE